LPEGEECASDEEFNAFIKEQKPVLFTILPESFIEFTDFEEPLH
jgi:hypothetical protein